MGLFQFIKDVGSKISGKVDAQAVEEKIKTDLGSQIIELTAEVNEGEVVLTGTCESNAAKEKAVLIAGNINGVASVNYFKLRVADGGTSSDTSDEEAEKAIDEAADADTKQADEGSSSEETEFYTIASGDTLSKLAKRYYGDAGKYTVIFDANLEVIKDPNKIYVGQTIRIPKTA